MLCRKAALITKLCSEWLLRFTVKRIKYNSLPSDLSDLQMRTARSPDGPSIADRDTGIKSERTGEKNRIETINNVCPLQPRGA